VGRSATLLIITALAILIVATVQTVNTTRANPYPSGAVFLEEPDTTPPSVSLQLPTESIYNVSSISYYLVVVKPSTWTYDNYLSSVEYVLDNETPVVIADRSMLQNESNYKADYYVPSNLAVQPLGFKGNIKGVPDGGHSLTFQVRSVSSYFPIEMRRQYFDWWRGEPEVYSYVTASSTIHFTVDTSPPNISNLSVEDKVYSSTDVPLQFIINEAASQISYSLDNHANVTINGNTTLTGLVEGSHSLTIYANDAAGNMGTSQTIYFTVTQSQSEPFPTAFVAAASIIAIVMVSAGLLVYFKKRKR